MRIISLDFETSIGATIHGPTFRDTNNDIYTQIFAKAADNVKVVHNTNGFKRKLCGSRNWLHGVDLIIGHNISFDLCYIWNDPQLQDFLLRGGKIWDTMQAEYILTGQQHTTASLAELQLKHLGEKVKPSRISYLFKKGIGADRIVQKGIKCSRLWGLYNKYCKSDGATPILIYEKQLALAKEKGMLKIVELYNDYLLSIINMTCSGIKIDLDLTEKTLNQFNLRHLEKLEEAQEIIKQYWTDPRLPPFLISSVDHKSALLFGGNIKVREQRLIGQYKNGKDKYKLFDVDVFVKGFGVPIHLTKESKKKGVYSTDDKVMTEIKNNTKNPLLRKYCELQEEAMMYKKAAKTYCQAFLERSVNGVLYPNFNTTITPTGRLTSSEPNTQNIPSKGELAEPIMQLMVAPRDHKCVSVDFSQLEKWTQAWVSRDENLIKALLEGKCLHCITLANLLKLDYDFVYNKAKVEKDPVWDKRRTEVKPVGFLMDYGGMEARVSKETGLPLEEVQKIYETDRTLYPRKHFFFEKLLPMQVDKNSNASFIKNIPRNKLSGRKFNQHGYELLPIFDTAGNIRYNDQQVRRVGYWKTSYGKLYHFLESGRLTKNGVKASFSLPQFKNYPNQGGGGDIQAATTAALLPTLLQKSDRIKMINEVHDSKWFYIREDVLEPCLAWLKETIENVPKILKEKLNAEIPFRIPVEIKIGDDFGNMFVYQREEK